MKYIYIKLPVGAMSEEERVKVKGLVKSLLTAIYKDLTLRTKTSTVFYLVERLRDKKDRQLLLYVLMNFIKNHKQVSLESIDNHVVLNQRTTSLLDLCKEYQHGAH